MSERTEFGTHAPARAHRTGPGATRPRRRGPGLATAVVLGLSQTACAGSRVLPPEPSPLPPESAHAAPLALRVSGVVFDRWGYAVPDASVTVRVGSPAGTPGADPACPDASHLPTRTRTSPTGEFSVVVEAGRREPFEACLEVEALPPARSPWRENRMVVPVAPFHPAGPDGEPTRSVGVRVMLF